MRQIKRIKRTNQAVQTSTLIDNPVHISTLIDNNSQTSTMRDNIVNDSTLIDKPVQTNTELDITTQSTETVVKVKNKKETKSNLVEIKNSLDKKITFYCNVELIDKINTAIDQKLAKGDYLFVNYSQVIRLALEAHQKGMSLITGKLKGNKKHLSFRCSGEILTHYLSFPNSIKSSLLEKIIASYYEKHLV
jgi:hypothetical protein